MDAAAALHPDGATAISQALARRPDISWIALASGGTEVVCLAHAQRQGDHELLLGKLPRTPSIVEIRVHQVLHRFHGGPTGWPERSVGLTREEALAIRSDHLPGLDAALERGSVRVTEQDESLITALEVDRRATFPELERATGQPESVVKRRVATLFASGAVYTDADFPPEIFGERVSALLRGPLRARSPRPGTGRASAVRLRRRHRGPVQPRSQRPGHRRRGPLRLPQRPPGITGRCPAR